MIRVILLVARRSIKNRNETCLFKYRKRKTDSFYNQKVWLCRFTSYLEWPTMTLVNSLVLCLAHDDRRNACFKEKGVTFPKYTAIMEKSDKWNLEWPAAPLYLSWTSGRGKHSYNKCFHGGAKMSPFSRLKTLTDF